MLYDNDTFMRAGRTFRATFPPDDYGAPPWESECGHGAIRKRVTSRNRAYDTTRPGERLLGAHYIYDMAESTRIARRDGWGLSRSDTDRLAARLGRVPTVGDIAHAAVEADFRRMAAWCAGKWTYVGACVVLLNSDGSPTEYTGSLWGIESDAGDYLEQTAFELADEILGLVTDAECAAMEDARPDMYDVNFKFKRN